MAAATQFCQELVSKAWLLEAQRTQLLGLMRLRVGAFLCAKGKYTFEQKEFEDLAEISSLFLQKLYIEFETMGVQTVGLALPKEFLPGMKAPVRMYIASSIWMLLKSTS